MYTVQSLAEKLETTDDHILALIRRGSLKASNIGMGSTRPRWRISEQQLQLFLTAQTPTDKPTARRKREAATTDYLAK